MFGIKKEVLHVGLATAVVVMLVLFVHDNIPNPNGGFKLKKA